MHVKDGVNPRILHMLSHSLLDTYMIFAKSAKVYGKGPNIGTPTSRTKQDMQTVLFSNACVTKYLVKWQTM